MCLISYAELSRTNIISMKAIFEMIAYAHSILELTNT